MYKALFRNIRPFLAYDALTTSNLESRMITAKALVAYLLPAMFSWVPVSNHAYYEKEDVTKARYESIATDIAGVALVEKPLYVGDLGQVKTALLMASIASFESNFTAQVDDGRRRGDHGTAFCIMQVRPGWGIFLNDSGYDFAVHRPKDWRDANQDIIFKGEDLLKDRQKCLTVAVHMLRQDGISGYTGEGNTAGRVSTSRLNRAKSWLANHPFPKEDEDERQACD